MVLYPFMKVQTSWNLKLLYQSGKDPRIEKDIKFIEQTCLSFERKYKNKFFTKTPRALLKVLNDSEKLSACMDSRRPSWYFHLKTDLNSSDTKSFALETKYSQRLTEAINRTKFFPFSISKITL